MPASGQVTPAAPAWSLADLSPRPLTRLLVLQPTPFCNIDCSYCYLPQRNDHARMSLHTVRLAVRRLAQDGLLDDALTIVWHAGEPLVLPPAYYDEAFAAIADELCSSVQVSHAMQTNATLVDDGWCRFFLRHGVAVGVSVDGPAALHDLHRRTRRGAGTHARVVQALALLRAHGVPHHAIAVVTAATLAEPDAFYDWFVEQGITELGCNVDEAEGGHLQSSLADRDALHMAFLQRLQQRAATDERRGQAGQPGQAGRRLAVRELTAARAALRAPLPQWQWRGHVWPQNTQAMPLALISVAHNGDFCTFSPELLGQHWPAHDNFVLGNVAHGGYLSALQGPAFARIWDAIVRGIVACENSCAHFAFCGGGAPVNKLYEHGDFAATETLQCRAMVKRPFDAVLLAAEQLAAEADQAAGKRAA